MVVNDNAGHLMPRGVLGFFASKFAPTGGRGADSEFIQGNLEVGHTVIFRRR